MVVIWLRGAGRQVEIGRYQGHKTEVSQEEIAGLDDHNQLLFNKERRDEIMKNPAIVPPKIQKENEGKPIPYGLWDFYRDRYNWKLEIQLPDEAKVKDVDYYFYNGEIYHMFGTTLIEQYPNLIPDYLKWNVSGGKPVPSNINFSWLLENRYVGKIAFDQKEIFSAFREIYEDNPDAQATLIIYVNKTKSYANVRLESGDKEIWIMNNEITVRKTDFILVMGQTFVYNSERKHSATRYFRKPMECSLTVRETICEIPKYEKNEQMKNIIKYIALLLLTTQLASCQNKEKNENKI